MGVQRMVFVSATFPPFPASVPLKGYIEGKTGKLPFHAGGHMTSLVKNRVHHTTSFCFCSAGGGGFSVPSNTFQRGIAYAFARCVATCDTWRRCFGLLMPFHVALQRRRRRFVSGFPSRIRFSSPP